MKNLDVWSEPEWVQTLSTFLGCPLSFLVGSDSVEADAGFATFMGQYGPPHPGITLELVVKAQTNRTDDGDVSVWALVFFFVDKRRVAEQGKCFLAIEWSEGQWHRRRWEADEHGEWEDLETLD